MPPRGRTPYFIFMEEQRQTVRAQLLSERGEGVKVPVGDVGKALGQKWKALSDQEREVYKAKAQQEQQAAKGAGQVHGEGGDNAAEGQAGLSPGGTKEKEPTPLDSLLPLSIVRKVMLLDKDVSRVSQDGLVAVAMATNLLLGALAKPTASSAKSQKRKTVYMKDFLQAVKQDRRMVQAGLRDVEAVVTSICGAEAAAKSQAKEAAEAAKAAAAEAAGAAGLREGENNEAGTGTGEGEEENQQPEQDGQAPGVAKGDKPAGKMRQGGGGGGGGGKKAKADKAKAAALGANKIDTFFARTTA